MRCPAGGAVRTTLALAGAVRGLLADGRLPLGVRLPAERELAEALRVSRTTVTAAYRELRESGHLTSRRGAGSWTTLPGGHRVASSGLWTPHDDLDMIDLGCAALAAPAELVPAARAAADDLPRYLGGAGYHPTGIIELREAVAAGYTERGLPTSAEQIMVTSGTQHALDLVLRLSVPTGAQRTGRVADLSQRAGRARRPPRPDRHPRPGRRRPAGTPSCCSARCARPDRGWPT